MRRFRRCIGACLLLWGCSASQPRQEIVSTFMAFLSDVKAGEQEKILLVAPFLGALPASKRESAVISFRVFADAEPGSLHTEVARGSGGTYLLRVSVPGSAAAMVVPFHRNAGGRWEMSPNLEAVRHIDIVPAR